MTATKRPTRSQRNVLICAAREEISYSQLAAHALGYNPWYGSPERRDVIERVISNGWAQLGPVRNGSSTLLLTEAGRAFL